MAVCIKLYLKLYIMLITCSRDTFGDALFPDHRFFNFFVFVFVLILVDQTQTLYGHQIHGLPVILFSAGKLFMGGVQITDVFHFSGLLFHLVKFLHGCYIHCKDFVWLLHTFTRPPAKCFSDLGVCL